MLLRQQITLTADLREPQLLEALVAETTPDDASGLMALSAARRELGRADLAVESAGRAVVGNFFPDMAAWDKLSPYRGRGAGGYSVKIMFPNSGMSASMSVFDSRMYKKAHLHGPGRVIVIPAGEGYSILWEPNGTKVICPWGEAAVFTPPGGWYHQHFNLGDGPARYLKFGHLPILSGAGGMNGRDQIEYINEEQEIRDIFDEKLSAKNLTSLMPPEVYTNPNYEWDYGDDD